MQRMLFPDTGSIREWVADNISPDDIILASGGRLARHILDYFRRTRLESGDSAWLPIKVISLNEWLNRIWRELWPEYFLVSEISRLRVWLEAMEHVPAPDPSFEGIPGAKALDDNYATLIRHLINPCKRSVSHPLAVWSYDISRVFVEMMRSEGWIHPVEMPVYVAEAITGIRCDRINSHSLTIEVKPVDIKAIPLPDRIALIGLDQASPLERWVFDCLNAVIELFSLEIAVNVSANADDNQSASRGKGAVYNGVNGRVRGYDKQGTGPLSSADLLSSERIEAFSFPDPLQEVQWVTEQAIRASASLPLHRIGIAISDMERYEALFERGMEDTLGEMAGEGWSSFNITMGRPVLNSSLARAALLPLKVVLEGGKRRDLFSLLQSPYYAVWALKRHRLALLDRIWRKANIEGGLKALSDCIRAEYSDDVGILDDLSGQLALNLPSSSKATTIQWGRWLRALWTALGFPVFASEEDRIVWRHILECIRALDIGMPLEGIDLKKYLKWMIFFLRNKMFSTTGYENAGIQVMGLIEARGLAFDLLFIVGMFSGGIPQPARTLPFLSIEEKRSVQGGTVEDQYRFAERLFKDLIALSPRVILTRPEQQDGELLVPSPFFPDDGKGEVTVNLWLTQSPVWARSRWLSQTRSALCARDNGILEAITREAHHPYTTPNAYNESTTCASAPLCENSNDSDTDYASYSPTDIIPIPHTIAVTDLEDGIACPFRFFILHCLEITMLDTPQPGVPPLTRGIMLHKCLAKFVKGMLDRDIDPKADWEDAKNLLKKVAEEVVSTLRKILPWSVELKRWIGEDENATGLLLNWLEEEIKNRDEGNRWIAAEEKFSDLRVDESGIQISGRIDRVDYHPDNGLICWDYKTGRIPTPGDIEQLKATQILAYMMALQKGCIDITKINIPSDARIGCGFIRIDTASSVKITRMLTDHEVRAATLARWEARVRELFARLKRGDTRPAPLIPPTRKDEGTCRGCPVQMMCSYRLLGYVREYG